MEAKNIIVNVGKLQKENLTANICPRCGNRSMRSIIALNALSRHIDCYICSNCGIEEALLDLSGTDLDFSDWYVVKKIKEGEM